MRALLLAAGFGTRLRPITDQLPKCLVPIRGVPLLDYWLDLLLPGDDIERVLINTHYRAEQVQAHVECSQWRDRIDLVHEPVLLGTGGTVHANRHYFGDQAALVAHADNLTRFDLKAFIACHHARPAGCEMTMMTFETDSPHSCGIVEQNERNVVVAFHEKVANPPGTRANGAVYIMEPSVCAASMRQGTKIGDLSCDVIPAHVGRIAAFANTRYHRDIGSIASLERAQLEFDKEVFVATAPNHRGFWPPSKA